MDSMRTVVEIYDAANAVRDELSSLAGKALAPSEDARKHRLEGMNMVLRPLVEGRLKRRDEALQEAEGIRALLAFLEREITLTELIHPEIGVKGERISG